MSTRIKLPIIDLGKIGKIISTTGKNAGNYIKANKEIFLGSGFAVAVADSIRVRLARNKDKKAFAEASIKQKEIVRKHEAEIMVLREEASQAEDTNKRIEQLEQIIKNITDGGGNE